MRFSLRLVTAVVGIAFVGGRPSTRADAPTPAKRIPWTTSRLQGSPDPALPYAIEPAFAHLAFKRPVIITTAPGDDRLFVGELDGRIYSFDPDPNVRKPDLFFDLRKSIPKASQLYGLAFHPKHPTNRYVYVCYVLGGGLPDGSHVSRFEVLPTDPPRIDPTSENLLLTWRAGGHNGGCIKFGPDGYLYIATGDATGPSPPDTLHTGQDLSDLASSILRIDVDQRDPGRAYRVPPDNPFVYLPDARPEIWAYGFRNPWKMSFDSETGALWTGDVGWELWEMVFRVERGGNYGWSITEGTHQPVHANDKRGPTPILPPIVEHPHTEAASVTGGLVYRGSRLAGLAGTYVYGDYVSGKIWGLRHDGQKVTEHRELVNTSLQIVAFGQDHAGHMYILDYERTGRIYHLIPNPDAAAPTTFPRTLSETGLFESVARHVPAPGVIAYRINASMWADGAQAERWLALPGDSRIRVDKQGKWKFPEGAVFAKTLFLDLDPNDPSRRRRLETQLLLCRGETWSPYTYVWNSEQTDAALAEAAGTTHTIRLDDEKDPSGSRTLHWPVASRTECATCHNPLAGDVLGFSAAQLASADFAGDSSTDPLAAFSRLGLFDRALPTPRKRSARMVDPYDASADLDARARAYLHVNCAHCHCPGGGGTALIELNHALALPKTHAVGVAPTQGGFGLRDPHIIAPGDPYGSVLYLRMAKLGHGRMPRLGAREPDRRGVALIHDWIAGLAPLNGNGHVSPDRSQLASALAAIPSDEPGSANALSRAIRTLTSSTRGALALQGLMERNSLAPAVRDEIMAATKTHADSVVRDLFEPFLPADERSQRIGHNVDRAAILALQGHRDRGRTLFFLQSASSCTSCHRVHEFGGTLGPNLSTIGEKYPPAELLNQILAPSEQIEPTYMTYQLATTEGQIHVGLLIARTDNAVTLKDAQSREVVIPTAAIERLVPQQQSLMPERLLQNHTAQEVADLLAYLASLR